MVDLSHELRALGESAREVSDLASASEGRASMDRARRALLARDPVRRTSGRARIVALVAAACGVVLALVVGLASAPRPLSYSVTAAASRPGVVGEWVAADDAPLSLRFSDASILALAPGARTRVTTTSPRGADVLIERGAVHAAIAHAGRSARWALHAGPFEVRVTGTVFDASWDPMTETFELVMHEGSVKISGPMIPPDRAVVAGERLLVSVRDGRMDLSVGPRVAANARAPSATVEPSRVAEIPKPVVDPATADPAPKPVIATPAWKDLALAGKHRDALAAAEAAGFDHEVARASSSDLILLADAARLGGSPARARAALTAARSRGARAHTAFLLGKMAADQGGSSADAIRWLETYLVEQPSGAFAEQAMGRIVELSRRDPETASRAATRYLAKYPNGAHAALARSLVGRAP